MVLMLEDKMRLQEGNHQEQNLQEHNHLGHNHQELNHLGRNHPETDHLNDNHPQEDQIQTGSCATNVEVFSQEIVEMIANDLTEIPKTKGAIVILVKHVCIIHGRNHPQKLK